LWKQIHARWRRRKRRKEKGDFSPPPHVLVYSAQDASRRGKGRRRKRAESPFSPTAGSFCLIGKIEKREKEREKRLGIPLSDCKPTRWDKKEKKRIG